MAARLFLALWAVLAILAPPVPTGPAETPASLVTVTPRADGFAIHRVGEGQNLWTISRAYGVSIDAIRQWNGMAPDASDVYAGQKLLIIPATPRPPTMVPLTTATPTQSPTLEPVPPTAGPAAAAAPGQGPGLGAFPLLAGLLILLGGILLVALAASQFKRP